MLLNDLLNNCDVDEFFVERKIPASSKTRYLCFAKIATGSLCDVFMGFDQWLNKEVALKILRDEYCHNAAARALLFREGAILASLSHPNVVSFWDIGLIPPHSPFLALEWVRGENLREILCKKNALSPKSIAKIGFLAANALQYLHDYGILHCDIKPRNLMFYPDPPFLKWLDLGNACRFGEALYAQLPCPAAYASPEQILNIPLDGRSDIYSLGVALFELLTGYAPLSSRSPCPYHLYSELCREQAAAASALFFPLLKCLREAPCDRYASCSELACVLKACYLDL